LREGSYCRVIDYICTTVVVIAWVIVKFGINTAGLAMKMGKFHWYSQLIPY